MGEVDGLSSLSNDILIDILSRLPLRLAITTGTLSRRWRGLWTNTTSIDLTRLNYNRLLDFDKITNQITSPVIHTLRVELIKNFKNYRWPPPSFNSMLAKVCDRNLRQLKLTLPLIDYIPRVVFQTQSLVSIEVGSTIAWTRNFPDRSIDLPNLKTLTLYFPYSNSGWLEKLLTDKACPLLEQLSLNYKQEQQCVSRSRHSRDYNTIVCSHRNLRRLFINLERNGDHVVLVDAPKLEYLSVCAPKSVIFRFEEVPIALREANVEITEDDCSSTDVNHYELTSKFYDEVVSKVSLLSLRVVSINDVPTTLFRKATRLTLDTSNEPMIIALSSFLELCPELHTLMVHLYKPGRMLLTIPSQLSTTLRQSLKRIELKVARLLFDKCKQVESIFEFVEFFLREAIYLEHVKVDVRADEQRSELMFCNRLYNSRMTSIGCEVEFVGKFLKMSRKAGPKAVSVVDGKVVALTSKVTRWTSILWNCCI